MIQAPAQYTSQIIAAILARDVEERQVPNERVIIEGRVFAPKPRHWIAEFEYYDGHYEQFFTEADGGAIRHTTQAHEGALYKNVN